MYKFCNSIATLTNIKIFRNRFHSAYPNLSPYCIPEILVLTAGHCTDGAVAARVWFNKTVEDNPEYPNSGTTSYEGTPYTNPNFCIGCGSGLPGFAQGDVGVVVLSEQLPTSVVFTYAALPDSGLVDTLKNKAPIDFVGYGVQEKERGKPPQIWKALKVRLYAFSELVSGKFVHSDEFIRLALNPGGGSGGLCFGDSGGPAGWHEYHPGGQFLCHKL